MAISPIPPTIDLMPVPPLPTDAEAVFDEKAGASLTAQQAMIPQLNNALAWQAGSMAATANSEIAANRAAIAAEQSKVAAFHAAGDATSNGKAQVDLAVAAKNAAKGSADSAQVAAVAARASAGLPALVGRGGEALVVSATELGVEFADVRQKVGDVLYTSQPPGPLYVKANGGTYAKTLLPELFAVVGQALKTDPVTKLPPALPASTTITAFSPDGLFLAAGSSISPYFVLYKRNGDVFNALPPSVSLAGYALNMAWSPDGVYLAISISVAPYALCYKKVGEGLVRIPINFTFRTSYGTCIWSPEGTHLLFAGGSEQLISSYVLKIENDQLNFLDSPVQGPVVYSASYSKNGLYLAVIVNSAPAVRIFKRSGDSYMPIATLLTDWWMAASSVCWSPDSQILAVGLSYAPYLGMWSINNDVFSPYYPRFNVASQPSAMGWMSDASYLLMLTANTDGARSLSMYKWEAGVASKVELPQSIGGSSFSTFVGIEPFLSSYVVVSGVAGGPVVLRDGYPFNPYSEFQVPVATDPNSISVPAINTLTACAPPKLIPYIKAKSKL